MYLSLEHGTKPHGIVVKTGQAPIRDVVHIGEYKLSIEDFLLTAFYVLTNTNLACDDQRLQFVKSIQDMRVVEQAQGNHRLESDTPPVQVKKS